MSDHNPHTNAITFSSGANPAMLSAHNYAVSTLPDLKRRLQYGQLHVTQIAIKIEFATQSGNGEFMWLTVQNWNGTQITGTLVNQSAMGANVQLGQQIVVQESQIFDWLVLGPDGPVEGGFTDRLLSQFPSEGPAQAYMASEQQLSNPTLPQENAVARGLPVYVTRRSDREFVRRVTEAASQALEQEFAGVPAEVQKIKERHMAITAGLAMLGFAGLTKSIWFGTILLLLSLWQGIVAYKAFKRLAVMAIPPGQWTKNAELRCAVIIMANKTLSRPGDANAPALVLVMPNEEFDPLQLALDVNKGKSEVTDDSSQIHKTAAQYLQDEAYVEDARLLLPTEWTSGREVYAASLLINRKHLKNGVLDDVVVPVLFEAGGAGRIRTIPYSIATNSP